MPHDIPVVGYDDVELARHLHPSLSTIRQPIDKAGLAMVDALAHLIEGQTAAPIQLPTELIVRETSRPAAQPADVESKEPKRSSARR